MIEANRYCFTVTSGSVEYMYIAKNFSKVISHCRTQGIPICCVKKSGAVIGFLETPNGLQPILCQIRMNGTYVFVVAGCLENALEYAIKQCPDNDIEEIKVIPYFFRTLE